MTKRDDIIETMARAIWGCDMPHWAKGDDSQDTAYVGWKLSPAECDLMATAALTALEQSGYIVRPREATERMPIPEPLK